MNRFSETLLTLSSVHPILFWGIIAALLGCLGQFMGIYNALQAIAHAPAISPKVVMIGFRESFTSTIAGLSILLVAAICWFLLYSRARALRAANERPSA